MGSRRRAIVAVVGAISIAYGTVLAGSDHGAPYVGSPTFERLKRLAGRWVGTTTAGHDVGKPVEVEYRVTSGGSAVVETLFPGTPHEMVSVYTDRGGRPSTVHYCMLGNQPRLSLSEQADASWTFTLAEPSDIDVATETHMHALTVRWTDDDHLTHDWTLYEGGQPKDQTSFSLARAR